MKRVERMSDDDLRTIADDDDGRSTVTEMSLAAELIDARAVCNAIADANRGVGKPSLRGVYEAHALRRAVVQVNLETAIAALSRGCCTRAQAQEKGCTLCVPRYAAMDWIEGTIAGLDFRVAELEEEEDRLFAMLRRGVELFEGDDKRIASLETELRAIAKIAEPGHAWPYDRVMRCLEGK